MLLMSNMNDERKKCGAKLACNFLPTDFSGISGFPNNNFDPNDVYEYTQDFHGNGDSAILHITSIIDVLVKGGNYHEDHMMEIFACTLDADAF